MSKKLSLHLSLLKRAMRGFQWTPAQTGKEGLFRLVEQAQKSYKDEVTTRQKVTGDTCLTLPIHIGFTMRLMPGAKMNI